ncbi:MAG: hypothetical protein Q7T55_16285 [Solirubrobacteraceae bacterium]|nr:hypothetical protein [Solirubrobacteraceae bacterium]
MTLKHVTVPSLGPKPEGDLAAMRALASTCSSAGTEVSAASSDAQAAIDGMSFQAPAATRMREAVMGQVTKQNALATSLNRFAIDLGHAADRLEVELEMYEARKEAIAEAKAYNAFIDGLKAPTDLNLAPKLSRLPR